MTTWHYAPIPVTDDLADQIARLQGRVDDLEALLHSHGPEHNTNVGSDPTRHQWRTHTPTLGGSTTAPTMGTGAIQTGRWYRVGNLIHYMFFFKFGTSGTSAGSGNYRASLPTRLHPVYNDRQVVGSCQIRNDSTGVIRPGTCRVIASNLTVVLMAVADEATSGVTVTNTVPWAWTVNDEISGAITYIAARG